MACKGELQIIEVVCIKNGNFLAAKRAKYRQEGCYKLTGEAMRFQS
ncbi:hypothetical protein N482_23630 [Pseudoalteromonas luteoviolacea NCIMB 1942]|uniref:Uncharacterized protein n=1 Tax=Pseudoalteromonas luteoviolacea NCIMB 1942 TaxID=1365253 RepID=A0A167GY77_9GAMM|nr:hypothetical protein N482_23630 [Pseudoalteromonas luteoviolacea NCIMB 1942]